MTIVYRTAGDAGVPPAVLLHGGGSGSRPVTASTAPPRPRSRPRSCRS
ncbi:pimeloyl-ACP methyl ester carboxylesterase [Catenuloplanes nepalensis]|uniref:Pimeloyl-ACP methyl ester carboxylesterase n=1 Tax=Catenuloplanes nepalensis TaxID=587533 RepID=A0ABT9MVT1_9ACTN|nr:hypothetical protein [Catenuloplanes nepalensis]MDP9795111.1 pimeloyl-ACP methyl ester carboxylesterase [Catenuloplanes nepalensis]